MTDFPAYARAVWQLFCERRGSEFPLISPAEFDVMRRWREQGVAVRHVAQALEQTNAKGRRLDYYEKPVLAEARRAMRALSL